MGGTEKPAGTLELDNGYSVNVIRTVWPDGGMSYDVQDPKTELTLTEYSFDEYPSADEVMDLLRYLDDGQGIDHFIGDDRAALDQVLNAVLGPVHRCRECDFQVREQGMEDVIAEHCMETGHR